MGAAMATSNSASPNNPLQLAVEHHQAGRLAEADAVCRQILRVRPSNFGALYLLGVMALHRGDYVEAIDLIRRAVATQPAVADAHSNLGDAYLGLGELGAAASSYRTAIELNAAHPDAHNGLGVILQKQHLYLEAASSFRRAVKLVPDWAQAHFNLGLALRDSGNLPDAIRELRSAWILDPGLDSAARVCVDTLTERVRAGARATFGSAGHSSLNAPSVSIVYCSIDDRKSAAATELYGALFADHRHEIIPIRDARSLAEAYNRGVAASVGDVVVLSPDDIDILAPDFASRLLAHLSAFDVVGVIGATRMSGPSWSWSRHPYLRGWITHRPDADGEWRAAVVDPRPVAGNIVVLDGVFLAAHRAVLEKVAFDERIFDGFHLYDIDWSYRAAQAGFRLAAAGDLLVVHESVGRYDETWAEYADLFCDKYGIEDLPAPPPAQLFETMFRSPDEVRSYFACLADLAED
jgi:tetratricopeptide (TPR) repeat protein